MVTLFVITHADFDDNYFGNFQKAKKIAIECRGTYFSGTAGTKLTPKIPLGFAFRSSLDAQTFRDQIREMLKAESENAHEPS